jgi:endonuclease/exonuclease/phosphatase family metal-dependent hydrolase
LRILSWNLWAHGGADPRDIGRLVDALHPDLVLMQEATAVIDPLVDILGGHYKRVAAPSRNNGPAVWSPRPFDAIAVDLPLATRLDFPVPILRRLAVRVALVVRCEALEVANVHLDHGQCANRRQLRHILTQHPNLHVIMGDYNALGPARLPAFRDVGPRRATHRMYHCVPLRLDRCLVRGLKASHSVALAYGPSDHRPICVDLL